MSEGVSDTDLIERLSTVLYGLLVAGAERWAHADLTMPQLKVLLILGERGSARVSWLAEQMAVSPPNITGILDRLERRGWITRTADRVDRRVVRVVLSDAGREVIRTLCTASAERSAAGLRALSDAARRNLLHGLDALAATLHDEAEAGDTAEAITPLREPLLTNVRRGPQRAQNASARS
ncbi:MAG TPA: MarR family transcriptional regulator [Dehalococcoidia bacterium]|nr:MarR family transcriptional regulator [Dehalococcoidia bacterium]